MKTALKIVAAIALAVVLSGSATSLKAAWPLPGCPPFFPAAN